jgi:CubicO group peptidase (beta-lactamase class C family)
VARGGWAGVVLGTIGLVGVLVGGARAADAPAAAKTVKPADYARAVARLEQIVEEELKREIVPGVSIALVDEQRTVYARGFGLADKARRVPATPQTIYRAGSISKLLTAMAVMQLVEQGKLDLDKPVTAFDPGFRIVVPLEAAGPITLRQLLCHRSGMVRESPVGGYFDPSQPTIAATVASVAPCVLVYAPNTHTKYSNVGPTVAGQVVEKVAGRPFAEYQREHLLGPMGMNGSAFVANEAIRARLAAGRMDVADGKGGFHTITAPHFELGTIPAGNLYTTAEDLARLAQCLLAEGRAGGKAILRPESLCQMFTVQLTKEKAGFGLGFHVSQFRGHVAVSHMGAVYGFTTSIMVLPNEKLAAVVLTNADIATGPVRKLNAAALGLLLEAKLADPMPPPKPPADAPADPAALAGQYESESYWAEIRAHEGRLAGNISGKAIALVPDGKDKFLADGSLFFREPVAFERDAGSRVTGFSALGQKLHRVDPAHPAEIPEAWRRLLGSYGPEFIPLVISARHGHLYAMTENMGDYRLTPVGPMVFEFPPGMYVDEHLVFQAGPDGRVHSAILANMVLPRRP